MTSITWPAWLAVTSTRLETNDGTMHECQWRDQSFRIVVYDTASVRVLATIPKMIADAFRRQVGEDCLSALNNAEGYGWDAEMINRLSAFLDHDEAVLRMTLREGFPQAFGVNLSEEQVDKIVQASEGYKNAVSEIQ